MKVKKSNIEKTTMATLNTAQLNVVKGGSIAHDAAIIK